MRSRALAVLAKEVLAPLVLVVEEPFDLFIDHTRRVIAVVATVHEVLTEEDLP